MIYKNRRSLTNLARNLFDFYQRKALWLLVFLLCLSMTEAMAEETYSELVIFGDSLSDTGNHPAALLGAPYPYYQNRISNGPVAVDVLAAGLGLSAANSGHLFGNGNGHNYAVSGANAAGDEPHGLNAQLIAFINGRQNVDPNALYVMMIGGNDVRDAAVIEDEGVALGEIQAAADAVKLALQRLIQLGAESILVANVPDISKIPETRDRAENNPGIHQRAQQLSATFNQRLNQHLISLSAASSIKLWRYDFYANFNGILAAPAQYGFNNITQACFDNAPFGFHPQCDFEQFVFFDSIHPTAKVHRILGEGMLEAIFVTQGSGVGMSGVIMLLLE